MNMTVFAELQPLTLFGRIYLYAIHGFVNEIFFTAACEFVATNSWKLRGETSLWALMLYGVNSLMMERLYFLFKDRAPLPVRAVIYTVCGYSWEFCSGYVLRQFNACPWDYSHLSGDFMGLITLEYVPLWYFGSIIDELITISLIRRLCWAPSDDKKIVNADNFTVTLPRNASVKEKEINININIYK